MWSLYKHNRLMVSCYYANISFWKKKIQQKKIRVFFCLWWKLNLCKREQKVLHISKIMYVLINFRIREKSRLLFKIKTNYAYSLSVLCI